MSLDCFYEKVVTTILFPFKLIWFLFVTFLIGFAFVAWWGFVFGSVIAAVLMLIFAPELFLLPLGISVLYMPLFSDKKSACLEAETNIEFRNPLPKTVKPVKSIYEAEAKVNRGEVLSEDDYDVFLLHPKSAEKILEKNQDNINRLKGNDVFKKPKEEKDWLFNNPILLIIVMSIGMIGTRVIYGMYK